MVVASDGVLAGRLRQSALVHVELTGDSLPGRGTVAGEAVPSVDADSAVQARLGGALVDVGGAKGPSEALGAVADRSLADLGAGGTVEAG